MKTLLISRHPSNLNSYQIDDGPYFQKGHSVITDVLIEVIRSTPETATAVQIAIGFVAMPVISV